MGATYSTRQLAAQLVQRVPQVTHPWVLKRYLNLAYFNLSRLGNMRWLLTTANVSVNTSGQFTLPTDFDPGKTAFLSGTLALNYRLEIPYKPYDQALKHQTTVDAVTPGMYSVWTYYTVFSAAPVSYTYQAQLYPVTAAPSVGTHTLALVYHKVPVELNVASTSYFPTPDVFDSTILDMAESELRRVYHLPGWDTLLARSQEGIMQLIDAYRTTNATMAGLADQKRVAQEVAAVKAQ